METLTLARKWEWALVSPSGLTTGPVLVLLPLTTKEIVLAFSLEMQATVADVIST